MATFFKRLARATPIAFTNAFASQSKSTYSHYRIPFGAVAAISGGVFYLYYFSSPNLAHLEQMTEEESQNIGVFSTLNRDKWIKFKLQDTVRVSHNSQLFRFTFDPNKKLGLDVASCIITRAPLEQAAEGKPKYVICPQVSLYTPISDPESKGYFDLLIKAYPEGKMSQHFASLKPGDVVEMKGPIEKLKYTPYMKKHIGMIAGGTGITPMLQVIEAILKNLDDNTQISLFYGNVSPDDKLLQQKLDVLAATHPNLKIFYTVDNPTKDWRGGAGYISKDMVVKGLPAPKDDTLILVCGPPGMMQSVSGEKAKDWTQGEHTQGAWIH